jgi:hypothetical protein
MKLAIFTIAPLQADGGVGGHWEKVVGGLGPVVVPSFR